MKDRKSVPAGKRVLYTEQPVPFKPTRIVDLKVAYDGDQLQRHSHALIAVLMERLTDNDKDLVALWSRTMSDAPRPPGVTAWHLLNIGACLVFDAALRD
jgi:hypothetical protein